MSRGKKREGGKRLNDRPCEICGVETVQTTNLHRKKEEEEQIYVNRYRIPINGIRGGGGKKKGGKKTQFA